MNWFNTLKESRNNVIESSLEALIKLGIECLTSEYPCIIQMHFPEIHISSPAKTPLAIVNKRTICYNANAIYQEQYL